MERFKDDYLVSKRFTNDTYLKDYQKRRLMYSGDHWNSLLISEVSADATKPAINYIKPNINHMLSMLSMDNPTVVVIPEEPSDMPLATGIGSLLKRIYMKRKVDKTAQMGIKDMLIYSKGYLGIRWNANLDNGDGDVEPYAINPFNIFKEPVAYSLTDSFFVHVRWLRSKEYVYNKYHKELEPDSQDIFNPSKKGIEVIESWYLPCKDYPNGRHIIWTNSDVLLEEDPPYKIAIPIVEFEYDKISTGDTSSMAEEMWGDQLVYMKTLGYIIDNLRYTNNSKYATDWQDAPDTIPTAPNRIIKFPQGTQFIPLATPPISPGWFNLLNTAIMTFPDISGVREVNMGTTSGGVTAASAIVALQEATKTRRDDIKDKIIAPAMSDFGKMVVSIMQELYTSDKIMKILEQSLNINDPKVLNYDVEFQYAQALPTDKATRLNLGMQLKQIGLLDAQAFSELFDDPVLAKLIMDSEKRIKAMQAQQVQQALQSQLGGMQQSNVVSPTNANPINQGIGGK